MALSLAFPAAMPVIYCDEMIMLLIIATLFSRKNGEKGAIFWELFLLHIPD